MLVDQIIGSWKLKSHSLRKKTGEVVPTSSYLKGRLVYTESGKMNVLIVLKERPETFKDLISYSGLYIIEKNKIFHHVDVSVNAERVNTTEVRCMKIENNLLTLTADVDAGQYVIEWIKEE